MNEFKVGDPVRVQLGELRSPDGKILGFVGREVGTIKLFLPGDYPDSPPLARIKLDDGREKIFSTDRLESIPARDFSGT